MQKQNKKEIKFTINGRSNSRKVLGLEFVCW